VKYSLLLSLVVLTILLSAANNGSASENRRTNQHKRKAAPKAESIQQQEPQVPLSVWRSTSEALTESLQANKRQTIAAEKEAQTTKQTFRSPSVVVNEVLALIGIGYLIFMKLQWEEIGRQADIAERDLEITQRAYLNVEKISISNFQDAKPPVIEFDVRNRGRLPASHVHPNIAAK
jgi:hypothetical protein